ncbi:aspartyl protease family protein [uncultured Brevundimonas sp.]|uniref:aspartyl protease family protein n=1 Tax=uncultured Brevundimonas sp. TaxID=213418 RepID=UPI0025D6FFF2|nr:aspartyl protease family protein [uncultured Brevundimonas sp.]
MAAAASATAAQARAQTTPTTAPPDARILDNLLTRVGVEVEIGQDHPVFVIDTGAERTSISDSLARRLDLAPGPDVIVHGITAAQRTPTVLLPRLEVLQRPFTDLVPPVFQHSLLGADGFLGLDVLSQFRLGLDFQRRRATLAPSGQTRFFSGVGTATARRIGPDRGGARSARGGQLLLSSVRIGDAVIDAFIDSGAQHSVGNLRLADLAGPSTGELQLFGVVGQSLTAQQRTLPDLKIARRDFGPTPLLFADLHAFRVLDLSDRPALLLGADLLTRFRRITLDYGASRVAFEG